MPYLIQRFVHKQKTHLNIQHLNKTFHLSYQYTLEDDSSLISSNIKDPKTVV